MKRPVGNIILLLAIGPLGACSISQVAPKVSVPKSRHVFSKAETKTLASLKSAGGYPFHVKQYHGEDASHPGFSRFAVLEEHGRLFGTLQKRTK